MLVPLLKANATAANIDQTILFNLVELHANAA